MTTANATLALISDGIGLCVDVMRQRASNERVQHHGCALLNFLALEEKNKETLFEKGAVDVGACPVCPVSLLA